MVLVVTVTFVGKAFEPFKSDHIQMVRLEHLFKTWVGKDRSSEKWTWIHNIHCPILSSFLYSVLPEFCKVCSSLSLKEYSTRFWMSIHFYIVKCNLVMNREAAVLWKEAMAANKDRLHNLQGRNALQRPRLNVLGPVHTSEQTTNNTPQAFERAEVWCLVKIWPLFYYE